MKLNKFNFKGQASVEYLVVLAIAIVIAVVAVGVLTGFIKIGSATTYHKKSAVYWHSSDIALMDWSIYPEGNDSTLVIQNNLEYQINIDWVTTDVAGPITMNVGLIPGQHTKLSTQVINCTAGSSYAYTVTFQFDNVDMILPNKQFVGVEQMIGECAL